MSKRSIDATTFDHIAERDLLLVKRRKGELCFRIHPTVRDPLWFGPDPKASPSGRFDAPDHEYRACYFGMSVDGAFTETLLRNPQSRILAGRDLSVRSISLGHLTRPVRLALLHGAGLNRLSISTETIHGPYAACRRLALALWSHPQQIDGLEYRSRFDNDEICMVLFDRVGDAVMIDKTVGLMDDLHWLARLLDKYDVGLDP